ncbi:hypothetical protein GGI20_004093 [Coemansia sp. BCRC 34301]|nr:hypothetical protein GGI20_004093 [Coemansia sp. BCRC 34301]
MSPEAEAEAAVDVATRVLYLRSTTQIDELMTIASSSLAQRWDFLGPQTQRSSSHTGVLPASFFHDVDTALQWGKCEFDIGNYIRHSHFMLDLTDEQAEIVCVDNVRFESVDGAVYALVPFANVLESALVVDLVRENGEWRYMDTAMCAGRATAFESPRGKELYSNYNDALAIIKLDQSNDKDADADDYWGQYSEEEEGEENGNEEEKTNSSLLLASAKHSLLGAAIATKALGATEAQFLAMARTAFNSDTTI